VLSTEYSVQTAIIGLSQSPRDRLEAFFLKHNPEKLSGDTYHVRDAGEWHVISRAKPAVMAQILKDILQSE
jgi:hypothetical protein